MAQNAKLGLCGLNIASHVLHMVCVALAWLKCCIFSKTIFLVLVLASMAPMKKAMKAMKTMKASKVMTKGALVKVLAEQHELKTKVCAGLIESLATLATAEVKKNGIFTIPGLCRIKTRLKPATKACTRMAFGAEVKCKAKPAKTIVKAFPVSALKQQI